MKRAPKSTTAAAAVVESTSGNHDDPEYDAFLSRVQHRFVDRTRQGAEPLFATDVENLFGIYLNAIPGDERGFHNCHACRRFIDRFGGLVTIRDDGSIESAIWDVGDAPDFYKPAIKAMIKAISRASVTGVFVCEETVYGTPTTGIWNHLALVPIQSMVYEGLTKTAFQVSAEKSQDVLTVWQAMLDFSRQNLEQAVALLSTDAMYRSEKVLGPAQWLLDLQIAKLSAPKRLSRNVVWKAVATAPAGFCHPRSSMIGSLLEDIAAGLSGAVIAKKFAAKMSSLQYQRPQSPPADGAIAAAEKIVEKLGAAGSLQRRFCRLDEIKSLWKPAGESPKAPNGVFGHLSSAQNRTAQDRINAGQIDITWEKFRRTVLDSAEKIEVFISHGSRPFGGFVTAAVQNSPPILQWDEEANRNPVSWYVWPFGAPASQLKLAPGRFHDVVAVSLKPNMWADEEKYSHHGKGVMLVVDGAVETESTGSCLFPEQLKPELHGVRSVIEAYSKSASMKRSTGPQACGILLNASSKSWDSKLRVTSNGVVTEYKMDRWD